jgi:hypothetical protein
LAEDHDAGPCALLRALTVPRFFLHDAGFLDFCFLIVARLAEFNPLLPCFPATYFAVALIADSLL